MVKSDCVSGSRFAAAWHRGLFCQFLPLTLGAFCFLAVRTAPAGSCSAVGLSGKPFITQLPAAWKGADAARCRAMQSLSLLSFLLSCEICSYRGWCYRKEWQGSEGKEMAGDKGGPGVMEKSCCNSFM